MLNLEGVPKTPHRTSRSRTVTKQLSRTEARHLETVFQDAPSKKTTQWNPTQNDADVINIKNLLRLTSVQSQKQRDRPTSPVNDRIIINVSGDRYETHRTTLELYPETLLGNAKRRKYYYDDSQKEYFFDRHRGCFQAILYYYQSNGRLRRPDYIPLDIFLEEVTFFQLGQEALNQIRKDENVKEVRKVRLPKNRVRRWIWATMEYPDYSCLAKVVNIFSLLMVLISTMTLAVESLPQYADLDDFDCTQSDSTTTSSNSNQTTTPSSPSDLYICHWYYASPFFIIQVICVGYFTLELVIRLFSTPSLLDFTKSIMNWIDFLAVVPFYVSLIIRLSGREDEVNSNTYIGLRLLRILRLARVFKFCRVFKSVKSLRVLATTVRQSLLDFLIMIIILTLLGFLFGSAAYYAENDSNSAAFDSILKATYWGIITITSVGYGEITPMTPVGRIIACLCALFGAATIGMLVSVLVDRYQRVFVRKLYFQEEQIDFSDFSDDENTDFESRDCRYMSGRRRTSKIEDPDARAKENAMNTSHLSASPDTSHSSLQEADELQQDGDARIHFIIGYVDNNDQQGIKNDSTEEINEPIVVDTQMIDKTIPLNSISDDKMETSHSIYVQQDLNSSNDDEIILNIF
ncbi:hypothetical protein I4U23_018019 [Adineta vaga]|nr:hypothetical protein I4U23_018019 [Adineta vaga]